MMGAALWRGPATLAEDLLLMMDAPSLDWDRAIGHLSRVHDEHAARLANPAGRHLRALARANRLLCRLAAGERTAELYCAIMELS